MHDPSQPPHPPADDAADLPPHADDEVRRADAAAEEALSALARVEAEDAAARREAVPEIPAAPLVARATDDRRVHEPGLPWRLVSRVVLGSLVLCLLTLAYAVDLQSRGDVTTLRGWPFGFLHAVPAEGGATRAVPLVVPFLTSWLIWVAIVCALYVAVRLFRQSYRERPLGGID